MAGSRHFLVASVVEGSVGKPSTPSTSLRTSEVEATTRDERLFAPTKNPFRVWQRRSGFLP